MTRLYLSNRFEQAVMARAIQKSHEAVTQSGGCIGPMTLQTIMYFLKRKGVPLPYGFDIYHFGPICFEIDHDVECLIEDGVVSSTAMETTKRSNYGPGTNFELLYSHFAEELSPYEDAIDQIAMIFSDATPDKLELVSTLDYIYQDESAKCGGVPVKGVVVNRFQCIKRDKFARSNVDKTYDTLANAELFSISRS